MPGCYAGPARRTDGRLRPEPARTHASRRAGARISSRQRVALVERRRRRAVAGAEVEPRPGRGRRRDIASRITPVKKPSGRPLRSSRPAAPRSRRRRVERHTRARRRSGSGRRPRRAGRRRPCRGRAGATTIGKPKSRGQPLGDRLPGAALVVGAVDAAVVLERRAGRGREGCAGDLVHALAERGVLLRPPAGSSARMPWLRGRPGVAAVGTCGRRRRSRWPRSGTRGRWGAAARVWNA